MLRCTHHDSEICVEAEQRGADKCQLRVEIARQGRPILLRVRTLPLIDCDCAAVERSALEVAKTHLDSTRSRSTAIAQ